MKTIIIIALLFTGTASAQTDSAGRHLVKSSNYHFVAWVAAIGVGLAASRGFKDNDKSLKILSAATGIAALYCEITAWVEIRRAGKKLSKPVKK